MKRGRKLNRGGTIFEKLHPPLPRSEGGTLRMRLAALRCEIKSLVHGGLLLFAAGRNRHNVLSGASLAGFVLKVSSGPPYR